MKIGDLVKWIEYPTIGIVINIDVSNQNVLVSPVDGDNLCWFLREELEIIKTDTFCPTQIKTN